MGTQVQCGGSWGRRGALSRGQQFLRWVGKACQGQRRDWMSLHSAGGLSAVRLRDQAGPSCLPVTFPHCEPGLILTSDDKDPNNGNLFGKGRRGAK